jgi:hypothetical protein
MNLPDRASLLASSKPKITTCTFACPRSAVPDGLSAFEITRHAYAIFIFPGRWAG